MLKGDFFFFIFFCSKKVSFLPTVNTCIEEKEILKCLRKKSSDKVSHSPACSTAEAVDSKFAVWEETGQKKKNYVNLFLEKVGEGINFPSTMQSIEEKQIGPFRICRL